MPNQRTTGARAPAKTPEDSACGSGGEARFSSLMQASGQDRELSRPLIALLRAEDRVGRVLERALAPSGLTEPTFNVLMQLAASGGSLPLCQLAQGLLRSPANVTALIDRMERDGLVRRVRGDRDRRTVMAEITETGWEALRVGAPAVFEVERRILGSLSAADRSLLTTRLDRVAPDMSS